jgi:hypothetical protein
MEPTTTIRKPGRPTVDHTCEIGATYFSRLILSIHPGRSGKDGPKAEASCLLCGVVTISRLRDIKDGSSKSCGCLKVESYLARCRRILAKLNPDVPQICWTQHLTGASRDEIQAAHGYGLPIIDEAIRQYQAEVDGLISNGTAGKVYLAALLPAGTAGAAEAFGLPLLTCRYLVQAVGRRSTVRGVDPYENFTAQDGLARYSEYLCETVAERKQDWSIRGSYPGEMNRQELRRSKGKLIGTEAENYLMARAMLRGKLDAYVLNRLTEFVNLAKDTLAARKSRRKAMARQYGKQRRGATASARTMPINQAKHLLESPAIELERTAA